MSSVKFGDYLAKILSFKTGNLLNNSKFYLLSEGTVHIFLVSALWQKKNMPLCHANDSPKEYAALVKLVDGGVLL